MGSLPNLNELCRERAERRELERDRDLARERVRERVFSRVDKVGGGGGGGSGASGGGATAIGAGERLPLFLHQAQPLPRHQQHHRHSLTARKVHRTRSSGATHHIWDDPMIEHMSAYSPISSRSHRTTSTLPPYQIQVAVAAAASSSRRRDSINSSIGATSIRRLLTVNRGCRHKIPVHIKSKVAKNFTFLVIAHGLTCAVLIPLFGLQGSSSTWFQKDEWPQLGPNIGSLLLSICFLVTAGMSMLTLRLVKKIGYIFLLACSYAGLCLFLLAHLYPSIYTLLPAYLLLGATLGPAWISKWNLVVFFASRISCGQHECSGAMSTIDGMDDHKMYCNRDERVRRLGRWYHAAENIGIVVGALIASLLMTTCSSGPANCFYGRSIVAERFLDGFVNGSSVASTADVVANFSASTVASTWTVGGGVALPEISQPFVQNGTANRRRDREYGSYDAYVEPTTIVASDLLIDRMFNVNEHGKRICGVDSCPVQSYYVAAADEYNYSNSVSQSEAYAGTMPIIGVYVTLALIALTLTCLSQQIDNTFKCDRVRGMTDTLLFAGPMAYFIGTEQAYVLGDFMKAFVSCSLGAQTVAGAMIGMGLMQLIVSCTLSMLLRHTKRYAVLAAGFFFHACLLLVLSRWKPSSDDSALFYAIAAAWGACNGMWETLIFALITLTHVTRVIEIAAPMHALRYLGAGITFAAHGFLCENAKILILFILLVMSVLPYGMLEVRLEAARKNHHTP